MTRYFFHVSALTFAFFLAACGSEQTTRNDGTAKPSTRQAAVDTMKKLGGEASLALETSSNLVEFNVGDGDETKRMDEAKQGLSALKNMSKDSTHQEWQALEASMRDYQKSIAIARDLLTETKGYSEEGVADLKTAEAKLEEIIKICAEMQK